MHMEIERKFLPGPLPFDIETFPKAEIVQGYISADPVIRLRRMGGERFLTVKTLGGISRGEFEMALTKDQFEALWKKTEPGAIKKTRYLIPLENGPEEGLKGELDIYHGALEGLVTLEVEFLDLERARAFTPLFWFGREVTGDHRYSNNSLAAHGLAKEHYR